MTEGCATCTQASNIDQDFRLRPLFIQWLATPVGVQAWCLSISACRTCWRAWLNARPRTTLGYCWHGKIAWRVKSDAELTVAAGVTRQEHRAMLEYVNEMESVMTP